MSDFNYQNGFGNHFESEAVPGVLPKGQNSPQKFSMDLYAEQLSGSAFTAPQGKNLKSWLYKLKPSAAPYQFKIDKTNNYLPLKEADHVPPDQMRWDPIVDNDRDSFMYSLFPMATQGSPKMRIGATAYTYSFSENNDRTVFKNSDGEMLIVPATGTLAARTEFGYLDCKPGEILVIPRGIHFSLANKDNKATGYVCENYGQPFELPNRGAIGANGLANERDFEYPTAAFEETDKKYTLINKYLGSLWQAELPQSPFDVVAWHGNYLPYKYDLYKFNTIGSISYDHPDPSIFTVLTSPSSNPGTANIDFVIFPPRWLVANNTFRPPYYHRNTMSEFMGIVHGQYDAKPGKGFSCGGASLHNCMAPHGPSKKAFDLATNSKLEPQYIKNTMSFMFESSLPFIVTENALTSKSLQKDYVDCWKGF